MEMQLQLTGVDAAADGNEDVAADVGSVVTDTVHLLGMQTRQPMITASRVA
jgi:hypothetical protein